MQAGQQIGTLGATRVNGGYKPHLHLGVRAGRTAEVGRKLLLMTLDGHATEMQITAVHDDKIEVTGATNLPAELVMGLDGRKIAVEKQGDKATLDAAFLYYVPAPDFLIVGYGLSTDGWLDPIDFLKRTVPRRIRRRSRERRAVAGCDRRRTLSATLSVTLSVTPKAMRKLVVIENDFVRRLEFCRVR